jgi:putative endonuclease
VYAEHHAEIRVAIQRERNMKHWPRRWKVRLILAANPNWDDLYDRIV